MENMSFNTKLEIAVEILATKIAICSKNKKVDSAKFMKNLMNERDEMYIGNEKIIDKIINEYGPEVKEYYVKNEVE